MGRHVTVIMRCRAHWDGRHSSPDMGPWGRRRHNRGWSLGRKPTGRSIGFPIRIGDDLARGPNVPIGAPPIGLLPPSEWGTREPQPSKCELADRYHTPHPGSGQAAVRPGRSCMSVTFDGHELPSKRTGAGRLVRCIPLGLRCCVWQRRRRFDS